MPIFANNSRAALPPRRLPAPGTVHLWSVALEGDAYLIRHFLPRLSEDEKLRAARYHFPLHRNRWVVSRYALRGILAGYAAVSPESLIFRTGEYGKPELANAYGPVRLHFNLAHSGDQAVLAVARNEVGIDIETINPEVPWQSLAPQVLSRQEYESWMRFPEELRRHLFFRIWTAKEAYLKARGLGLSMPLGAFSVPVNESEEIGIVSVDPSSSDGKNWVLYRVPTDTRYAATLAYPDTRIRRLAFEWKDTAPTLSV
ncbi:MAG: 4'-phosphopantetheinyl transferase family protein [Methylococcales bacterium]